MADPVFLNEGVSYDPQSSASPDYGMQESTLDVVGAGSRQSFQSGPLAAWAGLADIDSPKITGADATARYGVNGPTPALSLSWKPDEMVPEAVARHAQAIMQNKIQDDFALNNRSGTWSAWGAMAGS